MRDGFSPHDFIGLGELDQDALVAQYEARHVMAGGDQSSCRQRGIVTSEQGVIGCTLPEIRRLLINLVHRYLPDPEHVWPYRGRGRPLT
ncbi:hypothetical protein ACWDKQ_18340 [Saccharopolyspora sp. NPDC000995]